MSVNDGKWLLKRNDTNEVLELHSQFDWVDEHDWTPLAQSEPVRSLTGGQFIFQSEKKGGRPITLNGENTRTKEADIDTLQAWASLPKMTMTLTHPKGDEYTVLFRRPFITDKDGKRFKPADKKGTDKFKVNINLFTV